MFTPVETMATNSNVVQAWLGTVTAMPSGTILLNSAVPNGFVRYQVIATSLEVYMAPLAARWCRAQLDVFFSGDTQTPPWGKADAAAEAILRSVPYMAPQTIPGFNRALINEARIVDGPIHVMDLASSARGAAAASMGMARVMLDVMISFTPLL
jgi:hypothetical protein